MDVEVVEDDDEGGDDEDDDDAGDTIPVTKKKNSLLNLYSRINSLISVFILIEATLKTLRTHLLLVINGNGSSQARERQRRCSLVLLGMT